MKIKTVADLKEKHVIQLFKLASSLHEQIWNTDKIEYLGMLYEYKRINIPKEFRKKDFKLAFHVAIMKSKDEKTLDRVFIIQPSLRSPFQLFNINDDGSLSTLIEPFQDDLFNMCKYLIEQGFTINNPLD